MAKKYRELAAPDPDEGVPAGSATPGQAGVWDGVPEEEESLRLWLAERHDIRLAAEPVCCDHVAPWTIFAELYFRRPAVALVLGPRGGGKSYLSALHTHLESRRYPRFETSILGGSLSQSEQVYRALADVSGHGWGYDTPADPAIAKLLKDRAQYKNGSEAQVLGVWSTFDVSHLWSFHAATG